MNEYKRPFPEVEVDQRVPRNQARSVQDRREDPRFQSHFPVRVYCGQRDKQRIFSTFARNISDGGIAIDSTEIDSTDESVTLEFNIPDGTMPEQFLHGTVKVDGQLRNIDERQGLTSIKFKKKLSRGRMPRTWFMLRFGAALFITLCIAGFYFLAEDNTTYFWYDFPAFIYTAAIGTYLISRYVFAAFYAPPPRIPDEHLPTVSVVIPVFNEEKHIERTIHSIMANKYPGELLEVVAVNDGSVDRSLEKLHELRRQYPDLVIVDMGKNMGMPRAWSAGVKLAKGEVVVFSDSDCYMEPDALRNIVDGFADPDVAGVCGYTDVENKWTNMLTRMQTIGYYLNFRILKKAESIFDAVTCMSGPLSAYRRSMLMEVIDDWLESRYLGRRGEFADDRSLTNFLLKKHKLIFDSRAVTRTIVPEDYGTYFKQQMRWNRSWFRENLRASLFMWRKEPFMAISFYLGFLLPLLAPLVVLRGLIYEPIVYTLLPVTFLVGIAIMSFLISATYMFNRRSRLWLYGVPYSFFYLFVLVWQLPYAMVTSFNTKWITRS
jgi:hyaluronan synthase